MTTGLVGPNLQARLPVEIMDGNRQLQAIEVVLDTGFNESLVLPPDSIQGLGLSPTGERVAKLANGEEVILSCWAGRMYWQGSMRDVLVLQSDGEPLLGMRLLLGNRVTLDVVDGGLVQIDQIGPRQG